MLSASALVLFPLFSLVVLNRHDMAELFWIHESAAKKAQLLNKEKDREGPRLLVIGGSGAFYGIDAMLLERRLGMPCFNVATHAGLGLQYHLRNAQKLLRPGDIALLAIEHHLFHNSEEPLNEQQWGYYFTFDQSHLFARPISSVARLLLLSPPETFRTSFENWGSLLAGEYNVKRYSAPQNRGAIYLSPRGDMHIEQGDPSPIRVPRSYTRGRFPREIVETLAEFQQWCATRGVRVIATPPNSVIPSSGMTDIETATQRIRQELELLHIASVGSATDVAFPTAFFYDTSYHLHAAGRRVRTELLARRLLESLQRHPPPVEPSTSACPETLVIYFGWQDSLRSFDDDTRFLNADFRIWTDDNISHPSTINAAALRDALAHGKTVFTADERELSRLKMAGFLLECTEERTITTSELIQQAQDRVLFYALSSTETSAAESLPGPLASAGATSSNLQVGVCGFGRWSEIRRAVSSTTQAKIEEFDPARISGGVIPPYFKTEAAVTAKASPSLSVQLGRFAVNAASGGIWVIYNPDLGMIDNIYITNGGVAKLGSLYRITTSQ